MTFRVTTLFQQVDSVYLQTLCGLARASGVPSLSIVIVTSEFSTPVSLASRRKMKAANEEIKCQTNGSLCVGFILVSEFKGLSENI